MGRSAMQRARCQRYHRADLVRGVPRGLPSEARVRHERLPGQAVPLRHPAHGREVVMRLAVLIALLFPAVANAADPQVSPILYLNRCTGGCTVRGGFDDARANTSSIPCEGTVQCGGGGCMCNGTNTGSFLIGEFQNAAGQTGTAADAEWAEVMQCVREVYSPYNIMVTDTLPPGGLSHNQGIVAGRPSEIGYGNAGIGGIAPGTPGCDPRDNVISFTFSNIYGGNGRVLNICAVVAQETAHA